ncbi:hypothetical protein FBEOM_6832 [Fusarium beomiforme]|uniref:Uncharacterized protein n=1 Tax=Fusarium beomiforme TaxID=44412 RepID=A0A9P5DW05_9HYPO|nr:hypothetical protein FBEOM_6832 [Fusarium beomiforme]
MEPSLSADITPLGYLSSEGAYFSVQQHDDVQAMVPKTDADGPRRFPPRVLKTRSEKILLAIVDISLFACPLLFLVLAASAARLDSKVESKYGSAMMNLSDLGPTIFPVAFTTIVARLMKSMAYYLAEKGTKLRIIEQLVQSQSLASSIEAVVSLRKLTISGFFIMSVWLLSPLGGQSSLRVMRIRTNVREESRLVHYLDTNTRSYFGESSHYVGLDSAISSIFMASVIASNSTKQSPVDPWNNAKVPAQRPTQPDSKGSYPWVSVAANDSMDYLSLIGLRLWNIPKTGRTEFVMESSHLTPKCSKQRDLATQKWDEAQFPNTTFDSFLRWDGYNTTTGDAYSGKNYINLQFAIYSPHNNSPGYVYNCTLRSTSLDLHLICHGGDCKVNRTRTISSDKIPDWEVPWNVPACMNYPALSLQRTLDMMLRAAGTPSYGYNSPVEAFLQGNSPFFITTYISFQNVTDAEFSIRFGQLLNAIYLSTQLSGDIVGSIHEREPERLHSYGGSCRMYTNTTATVFQEQKVYEAIPIWIAFLILACVFLLMCCYMTFYIHQWVFIPDVFGFVSTSVSESPSFARYPVGSYMDGWERARVLGDVNIRFEDIEWHEAHGRLALVTSESVLGTAAPSPMETSWLRGLNLLLVHALNTCPQEAVSRKMAVSEVKFTLLSLANRRKNSGGSFVVTNEHLSKAMHYFDVRLLVYDLDYYEAEETNIVRQGYFASIKESLRNRCATDDSDSDSDDHSKSSSSASTRQQMEDQNSTSLTTTKASAPEKRKAPDMSSRQADPKKRR